MAEIARSQPPTGSFPKSAHLLRRADFQRVYQLGKRHFSGLMTVFYLPRDGSHGATGNVQGGAVPSCRVGMTIPKAVGKAVVRNRIRRRLREALRRQMHAMGAFEWPVDVVINPRRKALEADFSVIDAEVTRALRLICNQAVSPAQSRGRL